MNRSIIVAAIAALGSTAALAQSSITIYGRLNMSVENQELTNATEDKIWAAQNSSSRIGFKGAEDLGGGLKAIFLIEHGFSPDTGKANATFWGRESWVGLEGGFGRVRLGNMGPTAGYFATADYISMHNHDTGTSADQLYLYQGNVTNTIAWQTPNWAGFSGELQYGFKETGTKNTLVLAGNYDAGPLHLGAEYIDGADNYGGALGLTGNTEAKQWGLRALYEFGAFTAGAYYVSDKIEGAGTDLKRDSYRLSGMYTMGSSEFHLNWGTASEIKVGGTAVAGSDADQFTLGYNYNMSKRTKLYAFYTKLSGDGANAYADINGFGVKSAFALGVRHNF